MADSYPKVTAKAWSALRDRASAAPSTKFTPSSVAALMNMANPESARTNTVRPMSQLGLLDDDGNLTDLGKKWRVDDTYAEACDTIISSVYPEDLGVLCDSDGVPDVAKIRTWFEHKGFGGANAQQMAATYAMIARRDIPMSLIHISEPTRPY